MNNLKQLWTMQANYMAQFGGRSQLLPTDTGGAFWMKHSWTQPPLIDASLADIYDCSFSPEQPLPGFWMRLWYCAFPATSWRTP